LVNPIDPNICPGCDCTNAGFYLALFVIGYVLSSFFQLGVVKYGNATFSFIVSTIVTPLSEFAFAWPLLMGNSVEQLTWNNYVSLVILILGVIIYRVYDKQTHLSMEAQVDGGQVKFAAIPTYYSTQLYSVPRHDFKPTMSQSLRFVKSTPNDDLAGTYKTV